MNFEEVLRTFAQALEKSSKEREQEAKREADAFHLENGDDAIKYIPDWCPHLVIKNVFTSAEEAEDYCKKLHDIIPFDVEGKANILLHNGKSAFTGEFSIQILHHYFRPNFCLYMTFKGIGFVEGNVLVLKDNEIYYLTPDEVEAMFMPTTPCAETLPAEPAPVVNKDEDVKCIQIKHNMNMEEFQEVLDFFGIDFFVLPKRNVITSVGFDEVVVVKEGKEPQVKTLHVEMQASQEKVEASFKVDGKEIVEGNYLCDTRNELEGYTLIPVKDMEDLNKEETPCVECKDTVSIELPIREDTVNQEFPIKLETFPNKLGINLCSVDCERVVFRNGEPVAISIIFLPYEADYNKFHIETKSKVFSVKEEDFHEDYKNFKPSLETRVLTADDQIVSITYTV